MLRGPCSRFTVYDSCVRGGFAAAFGTICVGGTHGTCEDQKTCRDAEAAAGKGGDEATDEGRRREGRPAAVRDSAQISAEGILADLRSDKKRIVAERCGL